MPLSAGARVQQAQSTATAALLTALVVIVGCGPADTTDRRSAAADDAAGFQPTATVEDLMRMLIDPAADAIWDAVVITSRLDGLEERRPETDDDWTSLERSAMHLVEAGNLLRIDGRAIAGPDSVSEMPGVDLEPDEIAVLVAANVDAWKRAAREIHDVGVMLLAASRARDVDALLEGGSRLQVACESCHSRFWYPPGAGTSADEP